MANPYHYVDNDPLNSTDPTGLRPEDAAFHQIDECRTGGSYPTIYFPSDGRANTYAGYDTEPWYSKADDVVAYDSVAAATVLVWDAIPDAAENVWHFLRNSGNDKVMKVDKLLREVPGLQAKVEDAARSLARQAVSDAGGSVCNAYFESDRWDTSYSISRTENLNWFLAQGQVTFRVQGFVSSLGGRRDVLYQVAMYDPYDWDPADTRKFEGFSAPVLHGLHTAGFAAQYIMYGLSSERRLVW